MGRKTDKWPAYTPEDYEAHLAESADKVEAQDSTIDKMVDRIMILKRILPEELQGGVILLLRKNHRLPGIFEFLDAVLDSELKDEPPSLVDKIVSTVHGVKSGTRRFKEDASEVSGFHSVDEPDSPAKVLSPAEITARLASASRGAQEAKETAKKTRDMLSSATEDSEK